MQIRCTGRSDKLLSTSEAVVVITTWGDFDLRENLAPGIFLSCVLLLVTTQQSAAVAECFLSKLRGAAQAAASWQFESAR
jgi:hypothetical protein